LKFKTIKQRLAHHDKVENECKAEKQLLVKLIRYYKIVLTKMVNEEKIDIASDVNYSKLREQYEATEENFTDIDYFHCLVGKEFDEITKVDLNKIEMNNEICKFKRQHFV
jgi:hypothetical protein